MKKEKTLFDEIREENIEEIKELLEQGVDIEAKNEHGDTPLHLAVMFVNLDIIELLLEKGANIEAKNNAGYTPLHKAVIVRLKDMAKLLINKGADVNAKDGRGDTPLHTAVFFVYSDIVQLLLEKGSNIEVKNNDGETPLQLASNRKILAIKSLLKILEDIEEKNKSKKKLIYIDIIYRYKQIQNLLIEAEKLKK